MHSFDRHSHCEIPEANPVMCSVVQYVNLSTYGFIFIDWLKPANVILVRGVSPRHFIPFDFHDTKTDAIARHRNIKAAKKCTLASLANLAFSPKYIRYTTSKDKKIDTPKKSLSTIVILQSPIQN
jgi:hypothetical protein